MKKIILGVLLVLTANTATPQSLLASLLKTATKCGAIAAGYKIARSVGYKTWIRHTVWSSQYNKRLWKDDRLRNGPMRRELMAYTASTLCLALAIEHFSSKKDNKQKEKTILQKLARSLPLIPLTAIGQFILDIMYNTPRGL